MDPIEGRPAELPIDPLQCGAEIGFALLHVVAVGAEEVNFAAVEHANGLARGLPAGEKGGVDLQLARCLTQQAATVRHRDELGDGQMAADDADAIPLFQLYIELLRLFYV